MKKLVLLVLLSSFSFPQQLPELNAKVVKYVDSVMGKKVDRGECWDLANRALEYSGSYFDRSSMKTISIYGRLLNPKREDVLPGDLIQFEGVKLKWEDGNATYQSEMGHHTAIVYKVNGPGDFQIAHQNTSDWGRKVGVSQFVLSRVTKGKVMIYRPIKEKS